MQLVLGILICCLLGAIVVCGILLIIVQWMRLHNEKKIASGQRLSIPLSRLHMQQTISRQSVQKEEQTRFGMPVNLKKTEKDAEEKTADKAGEKAGQISEELKERMLQSVTACYELAPESVEVASAEVKDDTVSTKAESGQAEAEDLQAEEENDQVKVQVTEQKKLVRRKPFLELTKEMAIHEEELSVSMQRLIPAMEKLALDQVGKIGPSDKFSGNENEKASYYLEVIERKLS